MSDIGTINELLCVGRLLKTGFTKIGFIMTSLPNNDGSLHHIVVAWSDPKLSYDVYSFKKINECMNTGTPPFFIYDKVISQEECDTFIKKERDTSSDTASLEYLTKIAKETPLLDHQQLVSLFKNK